MDSGDFLISSMVSYGTTITAGCHQKWEEQEGLYCRCCWVWSSDASNFLMHFGYLLHVLRSSVQGMVFWSMLHLDFLDNKIWDSWFRILSERRDLSTFRRIQVKFLETFFLITLFVYLKNLFFPWLETLNFIGMERNIRMSILERKWKIKVHNSHTNYSIQKMQPSIYQSLG